MDLGILPIIVIVTSFLIILLLVLLAYEYINEKRWEEKVRKSGIYEVDNMTGEEFEFFIKSLLKSDGYKVSLTNATRDYGANLILKLKEKKIVVQTKRYKNKVGIKAVQEIISAKYYYGADECWVLTNNYFTDPAINLAESSGVILFDREDLVEIMSEEHSKVSGKINFYYCNNFNNYSWNIKPLNMRLFFDRT